LFQPAATLLIRPSLRTRLAVVTVVRVQQAFGSLSNWILLMHGLLGWVSLLFFFYMLTHSGARIICDLIIQDVLLMSLFQTSDVNQWVLLDLGQTSSVCGIVTQGRGDTKSQHAHVPTGA